MQKRINSCRILLTQLKPLHEGYWEILGCELWDSETHPWWKEFLEGAAAKGLQHEDPMAVMNLPSEIRRRERVIRIFLRELHHIWNLTDLQIEKCYMDVDLVCIYA